ncbi:sterol 3-beta-glucosyltransferase UGT80A2-like isoform X1 [Cucurbita pepo subsp. pepo]|uniref:sterol 3-beta-glucosyltransferase UGT80A2-like isoform X1 n=2 Tax=Cucurbita pepo subsp. pepo TaxID=3664 RepID=UPI000C9D946A|nr:sterol 3-beta-glucosyltransferase UGT80A2-like isoform X1 [Cucurbita pepo subsp. pepo]
MRETLERHPSSSLSSSEVDVSIERDARRENGSGSGSDAMVSREAGIEDDVTPKSNSGDGSPGISGKTLLKVNTMPIQKSNIDQLESDLSQPKLERSKTEVHKQKFLAEEAAKIFDDNISAHRKLKLLNRIATVKDDGTVEFEIPVDVAAPLGIGPKEVSHDIIEEEPLEATDLQDIPPLQIVMLIVGTRGDVQPFVAIGKRLQDYGHRVRLATHSNFKEFVLTAGLEFFALGGDPKILAGYMVKNKGFLPSGPSEIPVQRNQMKEIIYSLLPACKEPDPETGISFNAEAIIANPPAYGHTHVAEALKIPIHIFFTMPWTPTSEFPHPLSRVKQQAGYRLSYQIVDSLIWLGIRDMINDLRKKRLKLRPVTYLSGSHASESSVPHGYIWSPHLVPKPKDWGPKVDVVGFCFLDLASSYEPPESLVNWLKAGDKPIYIGFGSLPVQEPAKMTQIIVKALELTRQRGIINKGWGGLGNLEEPKDFVYLLDNCPHDWLFLQCKAVVHHGGAGTTAAGLKAACPTTIVPFFGDQPFWGEQVHARGVGPSPIPVEEFSLNKLVDAINFMLDPTVKKSAVELAKAMENEDGVEGAVKAFFKHYRPRKTEPESEPEDSTVFSMRRCFGCS